MKKWLLNDGTVDVTALQEIEDALLSITDQVGGLMDRVMQKGFIPVFRCTHSGLLLPGDYVKNWGRVYGVGMGPNPLSEVLNTNYDLRLPEITPDIQSLDQLMHPVEVSAAQVDWLMVHPSEAQFAVPAAGDANMKIRGQILRDKQANNPANRMAVLRAKWRG